MHRFAIIFSAGCADTRGLSEDEQKAAIEKYPYNEWANLRPDDGAGAITAKVLVRILVCPLTFGLTEAGLLEDRNTTFLKYTNYLYYNVFWVKTSLI